MVAYHKRSCQILEPSQENRTNVAFTALRDTTLSNLRQELQRQFSDDVYDILAPVVDRFCNYQPRE